MFSNQQHYAPPPGLLCKLLQKVGYRSLRGLSRWFQFLLSPSGSVSSWRQCGLQKAAHLLGGASREQRSAASHVRVRMGAIACGCAHYLLTCHIPLHC